MKPLNQPALNFRELFERYSGIVLFLVSQKFKNIAIAEGIVSAVFLRINKKYGEKFPVFTAMRIVLVNTRLIIQLKLKENNIALQPVKYDTTASVLLMSMQFGSVEELALASGKPVTELRMALVKEIATLRNRKTA